MEQKKRKSVVWLMSFMLVLLLSLTGCSNNGQTNQEDTNEEILSESEEAEEAIENQDSEENTDSLTESEEESGQQEREYPYDYTSVEIFNYENWWSYVPLASTSGVSDDLSFFQLNAVDGYEVMQGGCSDGRYIYMLLETKAAAECKLFKVDSETWEVVAESEPLEVDHGNGITYNSSLGQLIVAHCYNATNDISFIDPDTLTIVDRKTLDCSLYSLAYNETYDQYVVGITGTDFAVYDAEFNQVSYFKGDKTGLGWQNIACDDDYIYLTKTGSADAIICYDWSGNYCGAYLINMYVENEALIQLEDEWYMSFYTGQGGRLYKIDFDTELLK